MRDEIEPRRQQRPRRGYSFDDLFRDALTDMLAPVQSLTGGFSPAGFMPDVPIMAADIKQADDRYVISVDAPGMRKEDLDIEVSGNRLLISGERKEERSAGKGERSFSEVRYGAFERAFTLPQDVDATSVSASYENGVLQIEVPRKQEARPSKVEIREGQREHVAIGGNGGERKAQQKGEPTQQRT